MNINFTSSEIGREGEKAVVNYLKEKGYTINNWNTKAAGSTDIEAGSYDVNGYYKITLLTQVKTAISPNTPPYLSSEEERNIKSRATRIGAESWEARVTLSETGGYLFQFGDISWRKLD